MKKRNFSFHFSKTCISAIMSEGYYHKGMIAHNSKKGADCCCAINSCFSLRRSALRKITLNVYPLTGISSSAFFSNAQNGSVVAHSARSVVVCGLRSVGPRLTTSR